jgi:tRNA(adenine34) deaminase
MCYGAILLSGIREIVYAFEDVMGGATGCDLARLPPVYRRRITLIPNVLREKSISLLKTYFSDPKNRYWEDSLLAGYTLNQ